jgi:hypothetical protein
MLMGAYNGVVHVVDVPIVLPVDVSLVLDRGKESVPESRFAPAVKAARHSASRPIPLRQIAPGHTDTDESQDIIEDAAVVGSSKLCFGFLRWEERL